MRTVVCVLTGIVAFLTVGCFRSPPTHFYSLHPLPAEIQRDTNTNGPRVEVLVGAFPGYLNNPQMALRRADGEIVVDEYNRWIEELESNFERTVMENLVTRLDNASVVVVQPYQASESALSVRLEVVQFDVSEQGEVVLKVRWGISRAKAHPPSPLQISVFREQIGSTSPQARVAAQSRAVAALCDELARAVRTAST
jgi:uncharacterized lipoprotein YmbA